MRAEAAKGVGSKESVPLKSKGRAFEEAAEGAGSKVADSVTRCNFTGRSQVDRMQR